MGLYQDVYVPPTADQVRDEQAQRNRKRWATPRPPTLITAHEAVPRLKSSQPNRSGSHEQLAARRAQAAARYHALRAEGVMQAEARKIVAAEFNAAARTIADWTQGKR